MPFYGSPHGDGYSPYPPGMLHEGGGGGGRRRLPRRGLGPYDHGFSLGGGGGAYSSSSSDSDSYDSFSDSDDSLDSRAYDSDSFRPGGRADFATMRPRRGPPPRPLGGGGHRGPGGHGREPTAQEVAMRLRAGGMNDRQIMRELWAMGFRPLTYAAEQQRRRLMEGGGQHHRHGAMHGRGHGRRQPGPRLAGRGGGGLGGHGMGGGGGVDWLSSEGGSDGDGFHAPNPRMVAHREGRYDFGGHRGGRGGGGMGMGGGGRAHGNSPDIFGLGHDVGSQLPGGDLGGDESDVGGGVPLGAGGGGGGGRRHGQGGGPRRGGRGPRRAHGGF